MKREVPWQELEIPATIYKMYSFSFILFLIIKYLFYSMSNELLQMPARNVPLSSSSSLLLLLYLTSFIH